MKLGRTHGEVLRRHPVAERLHDGSRGFQATVQRVIPVRRGATVENLW